MISLIAVLACDAREFETWCRNSGLSPRDREVVYISRREKLRGLDNVKVIRCPRWDQHPDAGRIDEFVRMLEQRRAHSG
ncbi:hypothetical protein [Streptomyces sp. NBC_01716]|uniref:hypothetical protein n=1 Tax=Streptomyces sp. NBC_01716 TaxID=2975917 RepID=UPI002E3365C0|nr:hypothetical protein [Streptomyces sp. NBC_01716]